MVAVKISYLILAVVMALSVAFQAIQLWEFMRAGPRFTAHDGMELCERVKALESVSHGYKEAGRKPLDCRYEGH